MSDASMKTQVDELGNGFLRLPPQDLEAEKSLLASVLKSEGRDFAALKRIVPFLPMKEIREFLSKIDISKVRMDAGDLYWAAKVSNFKYD
ncbi:hypothetical protein LCGC14_2176260 [marine sediment metagenome]|uniref:Uncharacterized protein n=1 Tax=marine sediment metagenome TaxID=412755 RepID=A0A0F9DNK6_9ZZZZ